MMHRLIWVRHPQIAPFAATQEESLRERFHALGWNIRLVNYQPKAMWRLQKKCDLLAWSFVPSQLDYWSARIFADEQIGVIHELNPQIKTIPHLDHWLVPSTALHDALCQRGVDQDRIDIVHGNFDGDVDHSFGNDSHVDIRQKLGLAPDSRLILASGPISTLTGARLAVWAMNILNYLHPNVHLVLHGTSHEQERLEAFAHSINQQHRTHLLPNSIPIKQVISQADQVWLPQQWDGVPDLLQLALSAGSVILASDQPSLCEWLKHDRNALVLAKDQPPAWAAAAHRLLADSHTASRLSQGARKTPWLKHDSSESCLTSRFAASAPKLVAA
jgi:glycosyltransferase involved in cell wall biosynthesis